MGRVSDTKLEEYSQRLEEELEALESLLAGTTADSRPVDLGLPIGRLSRMDAMQMQGMAQMNRRQLEIRRERVKVALRALREGTFGLCRSCKQPVEAARLEAQPEVPFCIACQESFESEGR